MTACFAVGDGNLKLHPLGTHGPISGYELLQLLGNDRRHDTEFVFASQPIPCNINGWERAVAVVGVAFDPKREPVKQVAYRYASPREVREKLEDAERVYRAGKEDDAIAKFREVLKEDDRNFHANFRLAQLFCQRNNVEEAKKYWAAAKFANPDHPRVWTMAGVYYLQRSLDLLDQGEDGKQELSSAIINFTKARKLAEDVFDTQLEQYCICLSAISRLIRRADEDIAGAHELVGELAGWEGQTRLTRILYAIALVLHYAVSNDETKLGKADDRIKDAQAELEMLGKNDSESIQSDDLEQLLAFAQQRLTAAKIRVKRSRQATTDETQPKAKSPAVRKKHGRRSKKRSSA